MSEINKKHDTFFRETMSHKEVAADFLANYLPAKFLKHVRLDTLSITKDSFVDAKQAEHYSDLLYQVMLSNGLPGFVYFLFEHKSYPDRFVVLQLLRYIIEVWELYLRQRPQAKTLPLIIPVVVSNNKFKGPTTRLNEIIATQDSDFDAYVPDFKLAFEDFSPENEIDMIGKKYLNLFEQSLTHIYFRDFKKLLSPFTESLKILEQLESDATSREWCRCLSIFTLYSMGASDSFDDFFGMIFLKKP
ncbi:Rpn family recombination-promoting nuclease/putative transposase [Desulfonatronum parangueonense]